MGRPPVKSTRALVKAKLVAEAKFMNSNIGKEVWTRQQIERLIEKIDPLELIAVIGGTVVIYDLIKSIPELMALAVEYTAWSRAMLVISAMPLFSWIIEKINPGALENDLKIELTAEQKAQFEAVKKEFDPVILVKSFVISYLMIKHSGQIINGVGNMTGFVASMLGAKVV